MDHPRGLNQSLQQFHAADAPALLALSESIGWPHTLQDWHTLLASGEVFGHRAPTGEVLSSSAIFRYGDALTSIGMVIVRKELRRQGLGRAAVLKCLELAPRQPVMLVATTEGEPLYESLGFQPIEQVHNLIAPATPSLPRGATREIRESDLPTLFALDRITYGADRTTVLANRWKQSLGGVMLPDGRGFAWKTAQRDRLIIGPVLAPDSDSALHLIAQLSAGHPGPIRIDAPARHAAFIERLIAAGFERRATRPLMLKNAARLPGDRDLLFAFAALGYG